MWFAVVLQRAYRGSFEGKPTWSFGVRSENFYLQALIKLVYYKYTCMYTWLVQEATGKVICPVSSSHTQGTFPLKNFPVFFTVGIQGLRAWGLALAVYCTGAT